MNAREGRSFQQRDLFGGHGEVIVRDLLAGQDAGPFTAVLACELEPQGSVGAHLQANDSELLLVLKGSGKAHIGSTEHALTEATTLFLPLGETLALTNESETEALRYLLIKARA
jgi:quercetin dioxygenase-like cupin family protein